jgi:outer membrane protein insertion porin family
MVGVHSDPLIRRSACWACILAWWINAVAAAQGPAFPQSGPMPGESAPPIVAPPPGSPGGPSGYRPMNPENVGPPNAPAARPGETLVADLVFEGLKVVRRGSLPKLGTRPGEPYDPQVVEDDVRKLMKSRKFIDVSPKVKNTPQGVLVIIQVVERPIIQDIQMVGNQGVLTSTLIGKTDLKKGDGMDPYSIKEARDKLEVYYQEHGWDRARISILEGNKAGDRRAIFLIDEGRAQRVWYTKFIGNTIATGSRLRTQIDSKPPILWLFKGYVDRKKIDEDVQKLTAYYRGLGFFQATVGRELEFDEKQNWVTLTFVINEGPRYKIRNVSFLGNDKLGRDRLGKDLKLTGGQFFNQGAMNHDLNIVRDLYGGQGYVFADIQPDPRLLEGQAEMDLIYNIKEGSRYRVGKINITIAGDSTHTHSRTIYDRLSLHPGDILDTRKLRSDERRLKASQIFAADPAKSPKIVFSPLGGMDPDKAIADKPDERRRRFGSVPGSAGSSASENYRGQSPDGASDSGDVWLSMDITGELAPGAARRTGLEVMPKDDALFIDDANIGGRPMIVRGQAPAAFGTQTPQVRAQAPNGGWAVQSTDPDSMQRVTRYQPPPSTQATYPPAGYAAYPAAPGQPNVYGAGVSAASGTYDAGPADGNPRVAYQPAPGGIPPGGFAPNGVAPETITPGSPVQVQGGPQPFVTVEPWLPVDVFTNETQTGKLMVGVGVNSDAGLIGNVVVDEQNFDISRWPTSWEDFRDGTAFRGAGQRFRLEASPGTRVQRYVISFQEPYFLDTPVSFSVSGSYFTRIYENWDESRVGGRFGLGYAFTPDLIGNFGFRIENIRISNPTTPTPPELERALGHNFAYGFYTGFSHDTRDNPFLPSQGHLIRANYEQIFGDFTYPQATVEGRQYYKIAERPDGSGRHVLGIGSTLGVSGGNTPIYDEFYAGGYSTMRGFVFRGASPLDMGVQVGGNFEFLNTAEYLFPITADDALRGVAFVDFGTVERFTEIKGRDFRVAPGLGLRIAIPALGPAPIALDFAVPLHHAPGDREEIFSFSISGVR